MKLTDAQIEDFRRYYVDDPGSEFSPARSYAAIDECIKKADLERKMRTDAYTEKLRERIDASVAYILHSDQKSTPIEKYFGRQFLGYLQGQRIVHKLKRLQSGKQIIELEEI